MLQDFICGRDQSLEFVNQIQTLLLDEFYDTELYDEVLEIPVFCYRPGGGENLYDEAALTIAFKDALHELKKGSQE